MTAGQRPCAAAAAVSSGGGGARWTNQEAGSGDRDDYWARTRESSSGSQLGQRPAAAAAAVWRRSSAPLLATGTSHARTAQTAVLVRYSCTGTICT